MISKILCEGCRNDVPCDECIVFFTKQKELLQQFVLKPDKKSTKN
ncbi:MAG: hypothetical protein PHW04_14120 [Candidatus Wallbacteria bacterium]|nr:hypothetical protein [Candidatus Wallbacteria bacterium]